MTSDEVRDTFQKAFDTSISEEADAHIAEAITRIRRDFVYPEVEA